MLRLTRPSILPALAAYLAAMVVAPVWHSHGGPPQADDGRAIAGAAGGTPRCTHHGHARHGGHGADGAPERERHPVPDRDCPVCELLAHVPLPVAAVSAPARVVRLSPPPPAAGVHPPTGFRGTYESRGPPQG